MTMTTVEITISGGLAINLIGCIIWAVRKEGDLRVLNEKVRNSEMAIEHLTRAGEGIKEELSTLNGDIKTINANIEFIKQGIERLSK